MTKVQRLLSHRWRVPATPFRVVADDGTEIAGSRVGDPNPDRPALVFCHGLMGWHRKPKIARFAEQLSSRYTVFLPDLRGHGDSGGVCSYGVDEIEDVEAFVRAARAEGHGRVVTAGVSMGAISVVRHAGLVGGSDGVVAISCLASWGPHHDTPVHTAAWKRLRGFTETPQGRALMATYGVRLPATWVEAEPPEDVVHKIAPTPLLIVHGRDDHLFPPAQAQRLYERAQEPKRLLLAEPFGHAEDGLSPVLAARIVREFDERWDRTPPEGVR